MPTKMIDQIQSRELSQMLWAGLRKYMKVNGQDYDPEMADELSTLAAEAYLYWKGVKVPAWIVPGTLPSVQQEEKAESTNCA